MLYVCEVYEIYCHFNKYCLRQGKKGTLKCVYNDALYNGYENI